MNDDPAIPEPADLRLLDVLLAEELQRQRAARRSPAPLARAHARVGRAAAAALLLLGTGAVIGSLWTRANGDALATPAQGQDREDIELASREQLQALLPKLEGVVVAAMQPGPRAVAMAIADPVQIVQWMEALRRSCALDVATTPDSVTPLCEVQLSFAESRRVRLYAFGASIADVDALRAGTCTLAADPDLAGLVARAHLAALRQWRLANGEATDPDELRALPAGLTHLRYAGSDLAALAAGLNRFGRLASLDCVPPSPVTPTARKDLVEVLGAAAALGTVRQLALDANAWSRPCAVPLTTMVALERLELTRPAESMFNVQLAPGAYLLQDPEQGAALLLGLADCLPGLPHLRSLRLQNCRGVHDLLAALPRTRIDELLLDGTAVPLDDLRALGSLATLRTLRFDLSAQAADDDGALAAAFGRLQQLEHLELWNPAGRNALLDGLRTALPSCTLTAPTTTGAGLLLVGR